MKRILLASALLLFSISLFAAKPLKVTKGSLDILKEEATATWTIDLSDSQFVNNGIFAKENKGDFQTWCGDTYEERVQMMNECFFDSFAIYSPGLELVKESEAPYKMILKVDTFEKAQGSGPLGFCYISIYGTFSVLDAATGEKLLEVKVTNLKGEEDLDETVRFPTVMKRFCRDLSKIVK